MPRRAFGQYPSDVSDEELAFCAPYLTLMREDAHQREYSLRPAFNALRYLIRAGCPWRMLPNDLPPWSIVQQQTRQWVEAGVFETMAKDLRGLLRVVVHARGTTPSAVVLDSRTVQSTPESGKDVGYDEYKHRNGSKIDLVVDTLAHLRALRVRPDDEEDRAQVGELARQVQERTGQSVRTAFVDQGYTGKNAAEAAVQHGIDLCVVILAEAKRGLVLLPKLWVVKRSFAWSSRFPRLGRDYQRPATTITRFYWFAFICLMLHIVQSA